MSENRPPLRVIYVATAVTVIAFVGGYALAGALTIGTGPTEAANGSFESTTAISWWSQTAIGLAAMPSPVPGSVAGTTAGSPQVLGSTTLAYALNAATAGDVTQYFKMTEASGAPASTELSIVFTLSVNATPVAKIVTAFLETPSSSPSSAVSYTFYYDLGSATGGTIVLNSVQEISQTCASVGSCP